MPGICALLTLSGSGFSHRSGFHSSASGPQISVFLFAPRIDMMTFVFFLMGTSLIVDFPSADLIGHKRGMTMSLRVLARSSFTTHFRRSLKTIYSHANEVRHRGEHAKRFATDSVKIRKAHQSIIVEFAASLFARRRDGRSQFILHVLVLG